MTCVILNVDVLAYDYTVLLFFLQRGAPHSKEQHTIRGQQFYRGLWPQRMCSGINLYENVFEFMMQSSAVPSINAKHPFINVVGDALATLVWSEKVYMYTNANLKPLCAHWILLTLCNFYLARACRIAPMLNWVFVGRTNNRYLFFAVSTLPYRYLFFAVFFAAFSLLCSLLLLLDPLPSCQRC